MEPTRSAIATTIQHLKDRLNRAPALRTYPPAHLSHTQLQEVIELADKVTALDAKSMDLLRTTNKSVTTIQECLSHTDLKYPHMARCKAVEHFARLAVVLCLFHDDQLDDEGESAYQCVRSLLLVRSWPVDYDVDRITAQAARVLHSPQLLQSWTMESFGLYAYHFDLIETGEDVELRLKCVRHIYEHETIMHNLISALVMFTSADFGANDEDYGLVSLRVGVAEINFANLMQDHLATTVEEADGRTPVENPWTAQLTLADVENVEEGTRCTICLVRDAVDEPFQLSCNCKVMYHQDCINRWFATRDVNCRTSEVQCVYCRQPVRATIGAQVEDEEQDTFARYQ